MNKKSRYFGFEKLNKSKLKWTQDLCNYKCYTERSTRDKRSDHGRFLRVRM